jgi:hypothetical protein
LSSQRQNAGCSARERGKCSRSPLGGGTTGLGEALVAWGLVLSGALAVLVTYSRLPPERLYHTSVDGLAGGAGRTLVFLNFPGAVVAIALVGVAADALLPGRRRVVAPVAAAAVALCAITLVPGVVDAADLDARPINALPAAGVGLALALTGLACRERPVTWRPRAPGDPLRLGIGLVLAVGAVPWLFAELGFNAPDPILAEEVPAGETIAAVHLGHHHGTDGVLLALTALLLSRTLGTWRDPRREAVFSVYLALMLSYGLTNAVQDFWLEQVVKRGWTDHRIPDVLRPDLEPTWIAVVFAAAVVELLWFSSARARRVGPQAVTSSSHSAMGT